MCRRPAEKRHRRGWRAAIALTTLVILAGPALGQSPEGGFVLRPETQERLAALQNDWLEWLTAVQSSDTVRADLATQQLLDRVGQSGLERLPELAVAAAARAVSFAQEGREEAATRTLELAEILDPGRPEIAFAAARVARLGGDLLGFAGESARGLVRTFTVPLTRYVLLSNVVIWLLNVLALTGLAFIGVQMATRGQLLYRDLSQALSRSLPAALAHLLTLAILLWPALLPGGLLWVTFFWSVLLWGYGTRAERVVLVVLWIFLGGLPLLVSEQARRMDLALSRPARAVQNVAQGRLEGRLFSDVEVLAELLPDSTAVKHLMADLHLRLRQWEEARDLHREVLRAEPTTTSALADLGIGMFYEGDFDGAVAVLEDTVSRPDAPPEAFFVLGRAYAEELRFDKQAPMTQRASQMADSEVRRWLQMDDSKEVISVSGGFERGREIRHELATVWRASAGDPSLLSPWRRALSLPLALVFILPAIALHVVKRQSRNRSRRIDTDWVSADAEPFRQAALPGIAETENGRSLRGLAAVFVALTLTTLAVPFRLGYSLPLRLAPGLGWVTWLAVAALVVFFASRYRSFWLRPRKG